MYVALNVIETCITFSADIVIIFLFELLIYVNIVLVYMSRKNRSLLIVAFAASLALIVVNFYTIKTLSSMRAYINGEAQYSKGQKDALLYLSTYIQTEDTAYWRYFNAAISIPIGDNQARQLLLGNGRDIEAAKGFLMGKNHPRDIPDMIWMFRRFRTIYFMKSAIKIWGEAEPLVSQLDSIGANVHAKMNAQLLTPEERRETMKRISGISSLLSEKESAFSQVLSTAARNINVYLLLINVICIVFILGNVMMFSLRIMKRMSRSEDILQLKNIELTNSNNELDTLLHSISHDLRSPITSIKGLIELISTEDDPEQVKMYLSLMDSVVDRQNIFITDTIDFFKNKHQAASYTEVNMSELIEAVIMNNKYTPVAQGIIIDHEVNGDSVFSDELRLKMIVNNLLTNAIKYSDKQKPERRITVKTNKTKDWFYIEVEDNGVGMDKQYLEKIFDMFFVIPGNTKGTGLGLYILKENVEKLKGKVEVASQLAVGTKFTVAIPVS